MSLPVTDLGLMQVQQSHVTNLNWDGTSLFFDGFQLMDDNGMLYGVSLSADSGALVSDGFGNITSTGAQGFSGTLYSAVSGSRFGNPEGSGWRPIDTDDFITSLSGVVRINDGGGVYCGGATIDPSGNIIANTIVVSGGFEGNGSGITGITPTTVSPAMGTPSGAYVLIVDGSGDLFESGDIMYDSVNIVLSGIAFNSESGAAVNTDLYKDMSGNLHLGSASNAVISDVILIPSQASTGSEPAYVEGAVYYNTTLKKLRVGGAAAWETVTSV